MISARKAAGAARQRNTADANERTNVDLLSQPK